MEGSATSREQPREVRSRDAKLPRTDRPRRGGRRGSVRSVGGPPAGRPRPGGHRGRTLRLPRWPDGTGRHPRLPDRHRADRADHARHHRGGVRRRRGVHGRLPRTDAGRPRLPRLLRRREPPRRPRGRRGDVCRHRGVRGPRPSRRLPAAARLAHRALPAGVRRLHRGELLLTAVVADAAAGQACRHRRVPRLGANGPPLHHRRAPAADLHLPGPLRGRAPAAGAGRLRRDRLHGHRGGRVLPARRHAGGARGARGRGGGRRCALPLPLVGDRPGAVGFAGDRGDHGLR